MGSQAEMLAVDWGHAFDAANRAVEAVSDQHVPAGVLERERRLLSEERRDVSLLLRALDAWLPPHLVTPHMLGLPAGTRLVVFDLDGVLTDSDRLHATAWAEALDPLLLEASHDVGWAFVPFDRDEEYRLYFDGRARLEGVELFLAGRGLRLTGDRVRAVADRKAELVGHELRDHALVARPGARRYVAAAAHASIARAVVSASDSTRTMLDLAGLSHLVDAVVDGETMRATGLRSRPAPDTLRAACAQLDVDPAHAVALTHSGAGVVAAHAAGLPAHGIAVGAQAERLRGFGADAVAPSLVALLDPSLRP